MHNGMSSSQGRTPGLEPVVEVLYTLQFEQRHYDPQSDYSYHNAGTCPDCGNGLVRLGGCFSCPACGFSSCGI